jgi:hypothetical protein
VASEPGETSGVSRIVTGVVVVAAFIAALVGPVGARFFSAKSAAAAPRAAKLRTTTTVKATTTTVKTPAHPAATVANVRADATWILAAQLPSGAIANYPVVPGVEINIAPYVANLSALGLARATEVTGDRTYTTAAWKWLAWYQAHMRTSGFVTDYKVVNGVEVSTGDMDSTDAYAGTFLLAARRTWKATGDLATLKTLKPGITNAVVAVEATQQSDGLTWAKPAWQVKYLMDQAETYAGLKAGAELATAVGDNALAQRATADATRMAAGIAGLWDGPTNAYDWARHASGAQQPTDWSILYSDSLQQAWAVAFGAVQGSRAQSLVNHFAASQPKWAQPAATAKFSSGSARVDYWPMAGMAFQAVGRTADAQAAVTSIRTAAVSSNFAWPYNTGVAGELVLLESADANYLA